jgi:hypothetical protein
MRKIEQDMLNAVNNRTDFNQANTRVTYHSKVDSSAIYLHGNHIGTFVHYTGTMVPNKETFACWPTTTTRSRLRAMDIAASIKGGQAAIDGVIL